MTTLQERYRFFRSQGDGIVGQSAVCAISLARAEERAEREGLVFETEYEQEPWDGEAPAPEYLLCCYVRRSGERRWLASRGMVGVNSMRDPYLRVVAAELFEWAAIYNAGYTTTQDAAEESAQAKAVARAPHPTGGYAHYGCRCAGCR